MSETPPGGSPRSVGPQSSSPTPGDGTGALRVVAILVMIGSVLGLLGTGFCFLAVFADGYMQDMYGILLLIAPVLLFFAGSIWVCKALLERLRR